MKKFFYILVGVIYAHLGNAQYTISGTVSDSTNAVSSGYVKLFLIDGTLVDSIGIFSGSYSFNVSPGVYYVAAYGDTNLYPNHLKTYYGQSPHWQTANTISIITSGISNVDITLIEVPDWSGSNNKGFCSGVITYGYGGNKAGDPIPGVDVILEQVPGGIYKGKTRTNSQGEYKKSKLPNNSEYRLIVDIPGIPMDSSHTVSILNNDSIFNLDFIVDTTQLSAGIYVVINGLTNIEKLHAEHPVFIYPNPFREEFFINSNEEIISIRVRNLNGEFVKNFSSVQSLQNINLTTLPSGTYFIEITTSQGIKTLKGIKR
ncbi:MAG: T9SS C-terminal target domain-containing protein [Bacteroidetes bacterium]|nr:MAG: T9SS C-terminal target domain-containing protein [Bacteroidota bacterium]